MAYLLDLLPLALDEGAGDLLVLTIALDKSKIGQMEVAFGQDVCGIALLECGLGRVEGSVCLEVRLYQLLDVEVECVHADVVLAQRDMKDCQGLKGCWVHNL